MKKFFLFLMVCTISLFLGKILAQPVAGFTLQANACGPDVPLTIINTSTSTGCTEAANCLWTITGPSGTVNVPADGITNFQWTFTDVGSYSVTLVVTCGAQSSAPLTRPIEIFEKPDASFVVTGGVTEFCIGETVQFESTSIDGSTAIINYEWFFGDGTSLEGNHPTCSNSYEGSVNPPNFDLITPDIVLIVTDGNDCSDMASVEDFIQVAYPPVIDYINALPSSFCGDGPHTADFTSQVSTSSDIGVASYSWSFENGTPSTSNQPNPNIDYSLSGTHSVYLTVTDNFGCSSTFESLDYIQINEIEALYSIVQVQGSTYIEDNILCKGMAYQFINETGLPCTWEFSNGVTSTSFSTTQVFNQPGPYSVTLTVGDEQCGDSKIIDFTVEEVIADFTMSASSFTSCGEPITVTFTNNSSENATSFYWVFGDGEGSEAENPSPYTYDQYGTWQALLTAVSEHGCRDTEFGDNLITIHEINPTFTADPMELCVDDTVFFDYTGIPTADHILSWTWDFGDGSATSTSPVETYHIYSAEGDFDATLTVTDDNGCTQSTTVSLMVGGVPDFTWHIMEYDSNGTDIDITELVDHTLCAQDSLALYLYEYQSEENDYTWWMDSSSNLVANSEYVTWAYDQNLEEGYVHVITYNNGCRDTSYLDVFDVVGPIIHGINSTYTCGTRDFTFTLNVEEAEYWDWIIYPSGDPDNHVFEEFSSNEETVMLTLDGPFDPDEFIVEVTAYNNETGCDYIKEITVAITTPVAIFTAPMEECGYTPITFDASSSQNVIEYQWDFGDGTVTDWMNNSSVTHEYYEVTSFTVTLIARDANGCTSTYQQNIQINGPEIVITADPMYGCNSFNVSFTNNSNAVGGIQNVYWNWGDNSGIESNISSFVQHPYNQPGLYTVIVTVYANNGCFGIDTLPDQIEVVNVSATFTANPSSACAGVPIQFTATNINPSFEYTWTFNDGTGTENGSSISHPFLAGGEYVVSLFVDDGIQCNDTKTNNIIIQEANAYFYFVDDNIDCLSDENAEFINLSDGLPNLNISDLTYHWYFGNGDESTQQTPSYYYPLPGVFEVVLTATTSLGCTDTYSDIITLDGPSAGILISDYDICVGDSFIVQAIDTSNVASYLWIMGDGVYDLTDSTFTHVYAYPPDLGYYDVSLLIESPDGCELTITSDNPIYVYHSKANITLTDTAGCSPFEVIMSSASSENDDTRFWTINGSSFGTGQESENHTFENNTAEDILYTIGLTTTIEPYGCQDSKDTTITVYARPQIIISADTTICKGDAISIYASGGENYLWSPDIAISDTTIQFPVVNPDTDITYLVDVENIHGCHNTDSVHIIVQQDFDVTVTPAIDSVVIGDTVYSVLVATQENLTYSWSPTDFASCVDCPMPYFIPEESMRYTVTVEDSAKCFRYSYYIDIIVREEYTLDVPGAFTPLSANGNSIVYADGFGIRKLLQFRIYNRWGEEVFYTDDITKGWNGYYNGQLQNIDTYSYYVEAEMFDGTIQSKKGHIMLIR